MSRHIINDIKFKIKANMLCKDHTTCPRCRVNNSAQGYACITCLEVDAKEVMSPFEYEEFVKEIDFK